MDGKRSTFIVYFLDRILEKSMGRWVEKGNSHGRNNRYQGSEL
jgi:hypothetical protein